MAKQWLWHLLQTVAGIWLLVSLVFLLSHAGTVGADELLLRDTSDLSAGARSGTLAQQQAQRRAVQQRLGLNQPLFYLSWQSAAQQWRWNGLPNQYHSWLRQMLRGNLGHSLRTNEPVTQRIGVALLYTLPLVGAALLTTLLVAWWLAARLAAHPWWEPLVRLALQSLQALPLFVIALALLLLLANPETLPLFPAYGLGQTSPAEDGWWSWLSTYAYHALLPGLSLTVAALPALTLQVEATLREELAQPYIATAYAKGLSQQQVIRRHARRNALLPLITQATDLLPTMVAGALVVEVIFALPGMGRLLVQAATTRDYPLLVAGVLLVGGTRLLALTLADILARWADPRIR